MTNEEYIDRYNISIEPTAGEGAIKVWNAALAKRDNVVDYIKAHKAEIVTILHDRINAEAAAAKARQDKIDAIEGLPELESAVAADENYRSDFDRMMDSEYNDGTCPPKKPTADIDALKAKYPRAAAYIKAENWSMAENYIKSDCGKTALERIINGENHNDAIADMEFAWRKYCTDKVFD